jgi:hypothetical protein
MVGEQLLRLHRFSSMRVSGDGVVAAGASPVTDLIKRYVTRVTDDVERRWPTADAQALVGRNVEMGSTRLRRRASRRDIRNTAGSEADGRTPGERLSCSDR